MFASVGFNAPIVHRLAGVRLERLEELHNESDFAAWMGSIDHIRATPGFKLGDWGNDGWPRPMTLEENLTERITADLARIAAANRREIATPEAVE